MLMIAARACFEATIRLADTERAQRLGHLLARGLVSRQRSDSRILKADVQDRTRLRFERFEATIRLADTESQRISDLLIAPVRFRGNDPTRGY